MNNLEEYLKELFESDRTTTFTGVLRDERMDILMSMLSIADNKSIENRILNEDNPMISVGSNDDSTFVLGDTKRLISDQNYYNIFIAACKKFNLDNNFMVSTLGDRLKKGNELK